MKAKKKPRSFNWGQGCPDRIGLDSGRGPRVSLTCEEKDSDDYTDSSVYYNPPILYIRRSFQAVGVSAYQLTASPINPLLALMGGVLADCRGPVKRGSGCAISTIA